MENKELLRQVNELGLPLFEAENQSNVNKTLSEVAKSNDIRLWEGFPVLLANLNEHGQFDLNSVYGELKNNGERKRFLELFLYALSFYKFNNYKFNWADKFYKKLTPKEKQLYKQSLSSLKTDQNVAVGHKLLDNDRARNMFENYFNLLNKQTVAYDSRQQELSLEYALSQVFSPKQKELFLKKLRGGKLTKTEREYF